MKLILCGESVRSKKHKVGRLLLLFTIMMSAVLVLTYMTAAATGTYKVGTVTTSGSTLTVRSGPGTGNSVLGSLANGSTVVITGEATDSSSVLWYKISYNSGDGYVSSAYITNIRTVETTGQTVYTIGTANTSVNVRNAPGTSGTSVLTTLSSGSKVTILDTVTGADNATWYFVRTSSGIQGYSTGTYITKSTVTVNWDAEFEVYLTEQGFPDSYKDGLRLLHYYYPNWQFVAVDTGLNWTNVITGEMSLGSNTVDCDLVIDSWKSTMDGAYNWTTSTWYSLDSGNWVQASQGMVEYYMDPRNFMSTESIFQFLNHSLDSSLSESSLKSGLRDMLSGTFMYPNSSSDSVLRPDGNYVNYIDILYRAGVQYKVNPYVLAAMIIQEQGSSGNTGNISGTNSTYPGVYNYFNIGAYKDQNFSDATLRGLWYASGSGSYGRPWTSHELSIMGGASYFVGDYTNNGQNTQYYKKFNVSPETTTTVYKHQYMTNVQGAASEGCFIASAYTETMRNVCLTFLIPIYDNMPDSTRMPLGDGSPNNKLASLTVNSYSLTPVFNRDTYSYELVVDNSMSSVSISAAVCDSTATICINGQSITSGGAATINLTEGSNTVIVSVTAESGDERCYIVTIARQYDPSGISFSSSIYTISSSGIITGVPPSTSTATLLSGFSCGTGASVELVSAAGTDKSGDNPVVTGDLVNVYAPDGSLYKYYSIVIYGDVSGDGIINISDLLKVRNVVIQTGTLTGAFASAGDINKDGTINMSDLLKLRNHVIGSAYIVQ